MLSDAKERMTSYFKLLAEKEGDPSAADAVNSLIEQTDDLIVLQEMESAVEHRDKYYRRMFAYALEFQKLGIMSNINVPIEVDSEGKNTRIMNELRDAFEGYDMNQEIQEEINGNIFTYDKTFPIRDYRALLAEIGNEQTGNRWYVMLSDSGKLVIY